MTERRWPKKICHACQQNKHAEKAEVRVKGKYIKVYDIKPVFGK